MASRPLKIGTLVHATTRAQWRAWLRAHHGTAKEAWLVLYARSTGKKFVAYSDAVDEALCFGWIDSTVKSLRGGKRAQRYTPRRAGADVSELNRERVRRLVAQRRMTKAGLEALPGISSWLRPKRVVLAPDVRAALQRTPAAWKSYQSFPESYRRIRIGWIESARVRPEEFKKRLAYFVKMTAAGKRFGMVE